jgi:uncharacterized protein
MCYSSPDADTRGSGVLHIDELIWDEWNERHIADHGVDPQEVEETVSDPSSLFLRTRGSARVRRSIVLGLTDSGRYLFVVLEPFGEGRANVVTARDMSDGERRRFKRR